MRARILLAFMMAVAAGSAQAIDPPPRVFTVSAVQTPPPPPADKAQIIFIEPINRSRGLYPVALYELGDDRKLIGVTSYKSKTIVHLDPGKHMIMATQGLKIAHLLEANVEAGKRYFVMVRFIYTQGMQLRPLRPAGGSDFRMNTPDFKEWLEETKFIEMTPDAEEKIFTGEQRRKAKDAEDEEFHKWRTRPDFERAELTLNPDDAVTL